MNLEEILEKATPRPWGNINGPSSGKGPCDDGGDYSIGEKGGIFLEAIHKLSKTSEADALANILLAHHAVNNFERMLKALKAQPEGHREVCSRMTGGQCDCCQGLREEAIRQAGEMTP